MPNEKLELVYRDILFLLGYVKGDQNNDITAFEGTEEASLRYCLGLIENKSKEEQDV